MTPDSMADEVLRLKGELLELSGFSQEWAVEQNAIAIVALIHALALAIVCGAASRLHAKVGLKEALHQLEAAVERESDTVEAIAAHIVQSTGSVQ